MRRGNYLGMTVIVRGILGTIAVSFINSFLAAAGYPLSVGIGVTSAAVSGILGVPGLLLLYGIDLCARLLG